jgi:AcrR family transcriptional regulator
MTAEGAPARPLRADAVRNRARILEAAAEVFAERGLDVTLDDIAHHAGLGVGTVYRRFADRESLVEALFDERVQAAKARMEAALEAPDAWAALVDVLQGHCEEFANDRGLRQVMLSSTHGLGSLARGRQEIPLIMKKLVERAKSAGTLRSDFEPSDALMMFVMVSSVIDFAGVIQPELWRRYFEFFVDGMRARPARPDDGAVLDVTEPALAHEQLMAAMDNFRPATLRH